MIDLDDIARKKVAQLRSTAKVPEELELRIKVVGGGCAGFTYDLCFDRRQPEDNVIVLGEHKVLLDPMSVPFIEGTIVRYRESQGFIFDNPRAKSHCNCGASFRTYVT